jgi:hypothetical protein
LAFRRRHSGLIANGPYHLFEGFFCRSFGNLTLQNICKFGKIPNFSGVAAVAKSVTPKNGKTSGDYYVD